MPKAFATIAEETAVALTYGGSTHAVMMATPQDLEDFAVGFSLTERIVDAPAEIETLDDRPDRRTASTSRCGSPTPRAEALSPRRRHLAGPTGCGLCGVDSLAEAMRAPPLVGDGSAARRRTRSPRRSSSLPPHQTLHRQTGAVHAAALLAARRRASSRCAKTSAGTTRSTSWSARWREAARAAREACCS